MSDNQELAGKLEPYLIPPPWSTDMIAKFPDHVRLELRTKGAPVGLGYHNDYGWFALGTGQGPFVIWTELDPTKKIVSPVESDPEPEVWKPSPRTAGYVSFCPCCGSSLRVVIPDDEDWGDFCDGYRQSHGTEWFLCTDDKGEGCVYKDIPLILHNPVRGWDKPPGDNWAIGYVK